MTVAASEAARREEMALDALAALRSLTWAEGELLSSRLAAGQEVWSAAEAVFSAQCERAGAGIDSLYEESFEVGVAVENITSTAAATDVARDVVLVMTTCALAIMNPQCVEAAGPGVYEALVSTPLDALRSVTGR